MSKATDLEASPKTWPPLGLPGGSIRALLTLMLVAVIVSDLARGRHPDVLWLETFAFALAHYFAGRRMVLLPQPVIRRLEADGTIEREYQPLFLPRMTIRLIIVAAFAGLSVYLYRINPDQFWDPQTFSTISMVLVYLLGTMIRNITEFFSHRNPSASSGTWRDIVAVAVLVSLATVSVLEYLGDPPPSSPVYGSLLKIALGLVVFYFGIR